VFKGYMDNPADMELLFLPNLTDKTTLHSYKTVYDRYVKDRKTILEIGIQRGGSLITWVATGANVWGIDKDDAPPFLAHPRIRCVKGNAYSDEAIQFFKTQSLTFDMIVEDGSHKKEDILWAAKHYTELLSPTGVMIIEDIPSEETVQELKQIPGFFAIDYDLRPIKNRWDDRVVVLERIPTNSQ
jgi:cephalosporin hydroxylase